MFTTKNVIEIANALVAEFEGEQTEERDAIVLTLRSDRKKIIIDWPKHDLAEVWMTFYESSEETGDYQDWFECMEEEDRQEFVDYIRTVVEIYFSNPTKVVEKGWWLFKQNVLVYQRNEKWVDVLAPEAH